MLEYDKKEVYSMKEFIDDSLNSNKKSDIKIYPAQVKVERANFSIYELKRQYEERKKLIIDPNFQRENVWKTNKQKSELIEFLLMGIPLPIIYLSQDNSGKLQVIKGIEYLLAIFDFINNQFKLSKLDILSSLEDKSFNELDGNQQLDIEDGVVMTYIIKPPTPNIIEKYILDRLYAWEQK